MLRECGPSTAGLLISLSLLCAGGTAGSSDGIGSKRASELERLVRHDCGSCHGMSLKGGLGPDIRPDRWVGVPEDVIAAIVLDGLPGTAMPPWRPLLSDADARWIAFYLKGGTQP